MEFNLRRAVNVLTRKFYTNSKSLLIFAAIFFLVMAVMHFVGCMLNAGFIPTGKRLGLNVWSDMVCIIIAAGIFPFIELTQKNNAVFELLYPASRLEKFLTEFLTAFVLMPVCVFVIDIVALYAGTLAFKIYLASKGFSFMLPEFKYIFKGLGGWGFNDLLFVFGAAVVSFWGAVMFKKFRIMKTWVLVGFLFMVVCVIFAVVMYFNFKSTGYWFPYSMADNVYYNQTTGQTVYETAVYYKGQKLDYVPWFFKEIFYRCLGVAFTLGMFVWTCIRFKKERA
ncbi:MAG: hypothetical protein IJ250_00410 [Bacteroidales bacterium]|nr:hypothetical protein [Bacteroidales bacterium]